MARVIRKIEDSKASKLVPCYCVYYFSLSLLIGHRPRSSSTVASNLHFFFSSLSFFLSVRLFFSPFLLSFPTISHFLSLFRRPRFFKLIQYKCKLNRRTKGWSARDVEERTLLLFRWIRAWTDCDLWNFYICEHYLCSCVCVCARARTCV